jgi:hypothetical protein
MHTSRIKWQRCTYLWEKGNRYLPEWRVGTCQREALEEAQEALPLLGPIGEDSLILM